MIHRIYLGIGSNIEPWWNVGHGLDELAATFELDAVSSVYQSAAVGFDGAPFLNCVAAMKTDLSVTALAQWIRDFEFRFGRTRDCDKFSSRSLDIDILTYGDLKGVIGGVSLPRDDITRHAFVLCPFAEIAGKVLIPGQCRTLGELWSGYQRTSQPLTRIDYRWRGKALPFAALKRHPRVVMAD